MRIAIFHMFSLEHVIKGFPVYLDNLVLFIFAAFNIFSAMFSWY